MAFGFSASTHRLSRSDVPASTWPLTFHALIRLTGTLPDALEHVAICVQDNTNANSWRLTVEDSAGAMKARLAQKAGGSTTSAVSTTAISDNNWHSIVGESISATAYQVWLDNGGNASNSVSRNVTGVNRTLIGAAQSGASTFFSNVGHELANVAVWNGVLNSDDRAALALGFSPLRIKPHLLRLAPSLIIDGRDPLSSTPFTITGAGLVDHPRVIIPG